MPKSLIALILVLVATVEAALGGEPALEPIELTFEIPADESVAAPVASVPQEKAEPLGNDPPATTPRYGASGSTRLTLQTALAVQGGDNFLILGGFGFEHFIADDLGLVTQFNGAYVDQDGPEASGANLVLLLRWHYFAADSWSAYVEAGAGIAWFTDDVPDNGSQFNFTPQAAAGVTFSIGGDNRGYVAVGWHHVSNGQTFNANPGRDSVAVHFGISLPF